jgi:hypothetical protein
MNVRELILKNLGWKLLALGLGVLVYLLVQARIQGEVILLHRTQTQTHERTVWVLGPAGRPGVYHVEPPVVRVEVSGRRQVIRGLHERDIQPFVDLSDVAAGASVWRSVRLQPLEGLARVLVDPAQVLVTFEPMAPGTDAAAED